MPDGTSEDTSYLAQVAELENLLQINYRGQIVPWLDLIDPVAALFEPIGAGEYTLDGKVLTFAADWSYAGGAMASDGNLPGSQYVDPVQLQATAARCYVRRMVDNFVVAAGGGQATFEDFMGRIMRQMWDAFERMTVRHIHGSSLSTLCTVVSGDIATGVTVENGYGYPGVNPTMFLEPGMWVGFTDPATVDTTVAKAVATIAQIDRGAADGTAVLHFEPLPAGAPPVTLTAGDRVVFTTSEFTQDPWFTSEVGLAPYGLLDLLDPRQTIDHYLGVPVAEYGRLEPIRVPSADWGEVEFMEFVEEIMSRSNAPVTPETHTFTAQPGVKIELAKTLIPYTRIDQKGKELPGGWTTVRVAGHDFIASPYHIPDVVYAICTEDAFVVPLDGDPRIWEGDGSQFQRLLNFDGKQWFARHYVNRFFNRRNRCGTLTGVVNPNANRYVPVPAH